MTLQRLLTTMLALILLASVHAAGNSTLSCSFKVPSGVSGCFVETPVFAVHNFEIALGIDAELRPSTIEPLTLAGYAVLAWYDEAWSAWIELFTPRFSPVIGKPDWLRAGFTLRF